MNDFLKSLTQEGSPEKQKWNKAFLFERVLDLIMGTLLLISFVLFIQNVIGFVFESIVAVLLIAIWITTGWLIIRKAFDEKWNFSKRMYIPIILLLIFISFVSLFIADNNSLKHKAVKNFLTIFKDYRKPIESFFIKQQRQTLEVQTMP